MADIAKSGWIPAERIYESVQMEPAFVILGLSLLGWLIYKIFLRTVSPQRHEYLRRDFKELITRIVVTGTTWGLYEILLQSQGWWERAAPYVGLMTIVFGLYALIKSARILVYEYLIFSRMRAGVPLLIVNLFSLVLGLCLAGWVAASVFAVNLAPLLATSALISVVIGLAMQDTLGNIFAGIALQLDWKPYEIGEWLEIHNGGQTWVGQVHEISWRATTLLSMFDERITIPNRVMASSQIFNYSTKERPLIRTQTFRFGFEVPVVQVKEALMEAIDKVSSIRQYPRPLVLLRETTESWASYRLCYFLNDFGTQYQVGDEVNTAVLETLHKKGLKLATGRLQVDGTETLSKVS